MKLNEYVEYCGMGSRFRKAVATHGENTTSLSSAKKKMKKTVTVNTDETATSWYDETSPFNEQETGKNKHSFDEHSKSIQDITGRYNFYYWVKSKPDSYLANIGGDDEEDDEPGNLFLIKRKANNRRDENFEFRILFFSPLLVDAFMTHRLEDLLVMSDEMGYYYVGLDDLYFAFADLDRWVKRECISEQQSIVTSLCAVIRDIFADKIKIMETQREQGKISFESLWFNYDRPLQRMVIKMPQMHGKSFCFLYESYEYIDGNENEPCTFVVSGWVRNNKGMLRRTTVCLANQFRGTKTEDELQCVMLQEKNIQTIKKNAHRARMLFDVSAVQVETIDKCNMLSVSKTMFGNHAIRCTELVPRTRLVLDCKNCPNEILSRCLAIQNIDEPDAQIADDDIERADEDNLTMLVFLPCMALAPGNYFWGIVHVDSIQNIDYPSRETLMSSLHIEKEKKDLIFRSVTRHHTNLQNKQILSFKKLRLLFHGPPGTGKTMTSQLIAGMW